MIQNLVHDRSFEELKKVACSAGVYEVVWPRGNRVAETVPYARRLDTLEGKTVCELSNLIYRSDELFPLLEKALSKRYEGIKFVSYETFGSIHGGEERKVIAALPDALKQNKCDAVISGVGG